MNPSTRPLVAKSSGREPTGDPSPPQEFQSSGGSTPCANYDTPPPSCVEDHLITVPSGAGIDNAKATFRIEFSPVSDWDMKIYRADANGNATGDAVAVSGHGLTDGELGYEEAPCSTRWALRGARAELRGRRPIHGHRHVRGPPPHQAPPGGREVGASGVRRPWRASGT